MGYSDRHKGYKCFYSPTGRTYISRHVIFDETVLPFKASDVHKPGSPEPLVTTFQEWTASSKSLSVSSAPANIIELEDPHVPDIPLPETLAQPTSAMVSSSLEPETNPLPALPHSLMSSNTQLPSTDTLSHNSIEPETITELDLETPQVVANPLLAPSHSMITHATAGIQNQIQNMLSFIPLLISQKSHVILKVPYRI